jgi:ABC-type antimicrobial peptide transport system permease subunit
MALGAARRHVIADISRPAIWMVGIGCGAGLITVGILSPLVRNLFYNVSPVDPRVLGGTCVLLSVAAVAATWIPAWRAATVDPVVALREQ